MHIIPNKKTSEEVFHSVYAWLGICDGVKTFDDLEGVRDKQPDILAVREILEN